MPTTTRLHYAPHINVPHPNKLSDGQLSVGILDALNVPELQAHYFNAISLGPEAVDNFKIVASLYIAGLTHRALWFSLEHDSADPKKKSTATSYSPARLVGPSQTTDCYGHSIVASECLTAVGVEHWIAYANNHAFLLVPYGERTKRSAWLINPSSPRVSQDLTPGAVSKGKFSKIDDQIASHGRGAIAIHSDMLATTLKSDVEALDNEHGWFTKRSASQILNPSQQMSGEAYQRKCRAETTLITSLFPASMGRLILENFNGFIAAARCAKWDHALTALQAMPGLYPEIDASADHSFIRDTVRGLCNKGDATSAQNAIDVYFSSFNITQDPRISILEGDCWRSIALHSTGKVRQTMFAKARNCYALASERSKYSSELPNAKIRKLARLGAIS